MANNNGSVYGFERDIRDFTDQHGKVDREGLLLDKVKLILKYVTFGPTTLSIEEQQKQIVKATEKSNQQPEAVPSKNYSLVDGKVLIHYKNSYQDFVDEVRVFNEQLASAVLYVNKTGNDVDRNYLVERDIKYIGQSYSVKSSLGNKLEMNPDLFEYKEGQILFDYKAFKDSFKFSLEDYDKAFSKNKFTQKVELERKGGGKVAYPELSNQEKDLELVLQEVYRISSILGLLATQLNTVERSARGGVGIEVAGLPKIQGYQDKGRAAIDLGKGYDEFQGSDSLGVNADSGRFPVKAIELNEVSAILRRAISNLEKENSNFIKPSIVRDGDLFEILDASATFADRVSSHRSRHIAKGDLLIEVIKVAKENDINTDNFKYTKSGYLYLGQEELHENLLQK